MNQLDENNFVSCNELHIGNTPRSIMTKGTSTRRKNRLLGSLYGNFDPGNSDKLMISYRREQSHDYTMIGACSVLFEGDIHFFGGFDYSSYYQTHDGDFTRQHFVIETQRSGQLIKMTKKDDLEIEFMNPSCSSFEITSENFPWFKTNFIILCFGDSLTQSCYSFDGKLTYIGDSTYKHNHGVLTKYKGNLLTVGGYKYIQKTEIMKKEENKKLQWSAVESDFNFTRGEWICGHSLVTVESSIINEEYFLLIGGYNDQWRIWK